MAVAGPHRKQVKHYHEPGDAHEFTFSCYRRMKLLTNDTWRCHLARSIDEAAEAEEFLLLAMVMMPEHVHLLTLPVRPDADAESISRFLFGVKQTSSGKVKSDLIASGSSLLKRLTIVERPGKKTFRYWQEGPGYDRNLKTAKAILAAIDYIHLNPVRTGLVEKAKDWRWSSARWHLSDGRDIDPDLPKFSKLPAEYLTELG